jgi:hypothetical protein
MEELTKALEACSVVSLKRIHEDIEYSLLKWCRDRKRNANAYQELYGTDNTEGTRADQMATVYEAFLVQVEQATKAQEVAA